MTSLENARTAMFANVHALLTSEEILPLILDHVPVQSCITNLGGHLDSLDKLAAVQVERPGYAEEKTQRLAELAQLAAEVAGATAAYADKTHNDRLLASVAIRASLFSTGTISQVIAHCRNIHKAASSVAPALVGYNITAAKLKALKQKTDDYKVLASKPRQAALERKLATQNIARVQQEVMRLLKNQLDALLVPFKASHPEFHARYTAARRVARRVGATTTSAETVNPTTESSGLDESTPLPKAA